MGEPVIISRPMLGVGVAKPRSTVAAEPKRTEPKRISRRRKGILLSCLVLIGMLGLVELTFRNALNLTDSSLRTQMAKDWLSRNVQFNRAGFRDIERPLVPAASGFRMMVLGDSMVFGVGTDRPEDRFTNLLESRLNREGNGMTDVINAGLPGWTTRDQKEYFIRTGSKYNPKLVVLAYFVNDIQGIDPSEPKYNVKHSGLVKTMMGASYAFNFLYPSFDSGTRQAADRLNQWLADAYQNDAIRARHSQDLQAIKAACAEQGTELVVAILPVSTPSRKKESVAEIHKSIRSLMEKNGLTYVDLWEALKDQPAAEMTVSPWDAHLSIKANRLVSDHLYTFLSENGYLR